MIPIPSWATPTRLCGLAAFSAATLSCAVAWINSQRRGAPSFLPAILTAFEVALVFDLAFNLRWRLNKILSEDAVSRHLYEERRGPQAIVLVLLLCLFLVVLAFVVRRFRARIGALLALSGAALASAVWCVEVISYHAVDAVLYHEIGPFMAVTILWWAASLLTSAGILMDCFTPAQDRPRPFV